MTTAIYRIRTEHARCLGEYLRAKQSMESAMHLHGQLHGLEFAASCLDNDLGDALMRARHGIERHILSEYIETPAERLTCAAEFNREVAEGR